MTRGAGQGSSLEVFVREAGSSHWAALAVRHAAFNVNADGRIVYDITLPPGGRGGGGYMAQVLVLRHYVANSDVHYIPRANVEVAPKGDADLHLTMTGQRAELPELPDSLAGWEGRHNTFLSYTASARVLDDLLAFVRDLAPLGAGRSPGAAGQTLGRAQARPDPRATSGARDVLQADSDDLAEFLERTARTAGPPTSVEAVPVVEAAGSNVNAPAAGEDPLDPPLEVLDP